MRTSTRLALALAAALTAAALPMSASASPLHWTSRGVAADVRTGARSPAPGAAATTDLGPELVTPWAGLLLDRGGAPLHLEALSAPERRAALEGARMAGQMIGAAVTNATLQVGARATPARLVAKTVENLGQLQNVVEPRRLRVGEGWIEVPTEISDTYLEPPAAVISMTQVTTALQAAYSVCQAVTALQPAHGSDGEDSRRLGDCARATLEQMVARFGDAVRAHAPSRPPADRAQPRSSPARPPDEPRPQRRETVITLDLDL